MIGRNSVNTSTVAIKAYRRGATKIALDATPEEVALGLRHLGDLVFLDSSTAPTSEGNFSVVAAAPETVVRGTLGDDGDRAMLRRLLGKATEMADLPVPTGGLFGQVDFDGQFLFGLYENLLVFDHGESIWWEVGDISGRLEFPEKSVRKPIELDFVEELGREEFLHGVLRAKEYIRAGDIYQVNLSRVCSARWREEYDPFSFYSVLREVSPAPYGAYLELGGKIVLSASPECFLKMSGRSITTRPIKGTRPRFRDPDLDQKSAYDLLTSPKEIAELVMITDLERNDLGRICEYGTVRTEELLKLERFEQVYHRVSTVSGWLRDDVDQLEALHLCSPGGSISGAPKRRALEIIRELEPHQRGLYTGSIGYLGRAGESQFSIAIRTAEIRDGRIRLHVGAGIVADSSPMAEYRETLHKAAGFFRAARGGVGREGGR